MSAALSIIGIIGLAIFVVATIIYLVGNPRQARVWTAALIGLLIWAIAAIIQSLMVLF